MTSSTTSGSRKQPKAFQFIEGKPSLVENDDKENTSEPQVRLPRQPQSPVSHTQAKFLGSPSKFPSTPASRLPLADLIGDTDDANAPLPALNGLPDEQLYWNTSRSPRSATSKTTPAPKSRKRAHSISPPSASQTVAKRSRPTLNLDELKQTLKTPRGDPISDLWDRYNVTSANVTDPTGLPAGALTSSSPGSDISGNVGGLRRWTSCGIEWPSSKRKRRTRGPVASHRLQDLSADFQDDQISEGQGPQHSPQNKVGTLLERIKDSLVQSRQAMPDHEGPSSSSPVPDKTEQFDRQSLSPCRGPELAAARESRQPSHANHQSPTPRTGIVGQVPHSAFTSFGSAACDETHCADSVPAGTTSNPFESQTLPRDSCDDIAMDVRAQSVKQEEDDFGEDFDLSADDFDSMALIQQRATAHSDQQSSVRPDVPNAAQADDFGETDDDDLFAAAEASATQAVSASAKGSMSNRSLKEAKIQRYRIENVFEGEYTDFNGLRQPEQVIAVRHEESKMVKSITLRGSWYYTRCTKGSFVHIVGSFDRHGHCVVDDSHNMLILHPDHLISALTVADSFSCMRKAVLQDRVRAASESSPPMLYGTIIHEIFQHALQANRWDDAWLLSLVDELVAQHIEDLYKTGLGIPQATSYLQEKLASVQSWAEIFVRSEPGQKSTAKDGNEKKVKMSINKLLDVEEHIWSPMYGLKGNIDATVQVCIDDDEGRRTLTVPLELKTGQREMASHRAQTELYTLMLSDRYDVSVIYGVLLYVQSGEMTRIPAVDHELRNLIIQRNELACYVRERLQLPKMLRNTHVCGSCYAKTPCFLYHKLAEDGDGETSGLRNKFDAITKHLQPAHAAFFKKWDGLLTKEESEMMKFRRELWTMLSKEREKLGRCFANVTLVPDPAHEYANEESATSKIMRFVYTFRKHGKTAKFSFSESHITVGEPIVISDESGHYALARGYATGISRSQITVAVDRKLHSARSKESGFDEVTNQAFAGVMSLNDNPDRLQSTQEEVEYRIDKDEFSNGMSATRNNLVQLMAPDVFRARDLQGLIVDKQAPGFKALPSTYTIGSPASQANVNADQRAAIEKILSAEDYALVLGMPGTGKTTTIAHIIRALVAKGKSVLLTSYTHTAVDNILLKIRSAGIPVLRLGALAKIHPDVKAFAQLGEVPSLSIEELHAKWHDPQVVAATCLGVSHPLFQQRLFDYCIVDEASQITLPVCLGPIRMARTFVLVGDHYQLPPLVQNEAAKEGGLDTSLFKDLSEAHPQAVAVLSEQYRMNESIMSLSSKLIYDGRLKCGSPEVAQQRLVLPHFQCLTQLHAFPSSAPLSGNSSTQTCPSLASRSCLLATTFAPASPPVMFLNTDTLRPASEEIRHGPRITNPVEASIVVQLVRALLTAGVSASSIGVITLYRSQLALIKQELNVALGGEASAIEAHTADRYQGRDKEVIIISFVRSNDSNEIGELLRDQRRVNVSMTRAKRKMIFVGSRRTLEKGDELLAKLVRLCCEGGGMEDVPTNWVHHFATVTATQSVFPSVEVHPVVPNIPARRVLGDVPVNTTTVPPSKASNPSYKNPVKAPGKVLRGQKSITHHTAKRAPVTSNIMMEVIGEELSQ